MSRRLIRTGSRFEELAGFSRAVIDGEWIFVSGTSGYDFATGAISPDPAAQAEQCFATIEAALGEAGASLADVVMGRVYITDRAHMLAVAGVLAKRFDGIWPANTTVVTGLATPEMLVEIEVQARLPR